MSKELNGINQAAGIVEEHEVVPSGTFEAPQFRLLRHNHGVGYHCHLQRNRRGENLGILLTLKDQAAYAEPHGEGKADKHQSIESIGRGEILEIAQMVMDNLVRFSEESRRIPSSDATLLRDFGVDTISPIVSPKKRVG